jgi:ABC-type Zn uptake system ZnuABC Zn-binding protein ZnuA
MGCNSWLDGFHPPGVRRAARFRNRYRGAGIVALCLAGALAGIPVLAAKGKPIRMTTTLSSLRSLASTIGGSRVDVVSIAEPTYDPHFNEPKPSDIVRLGRSDFFVHMGLDLELWRGPLVEAAVNPRLLPGAEGEIDASTGIELLEVPAASPSRAGGDIHLFGNPHYWLDPLNTKRIARHIADKLTAASPESATLFESNLQAYSELIDQRLEVWHTALSPFKGSRLVAFHNSWPYLARVFDLRIDRFIEPKPGISPSGSHLEDLVARMKREDVRIIIVEPHHPRRTAESVAKRVSGRVIELWQNPPGDESYVEMMDRNIRVLVEALEASARSST